MSGKCVECIKRRHKDVTAPLNEESVAIVRQIATEVCGATKTPELLVPVRILIASLFAGCRRNCIAASLGMKNAEVGVFTRRLFDNHIWDWHTRVVPKSIHDAWVDPEDGNMAIILDAMVASGKILRRGERYFPRQRPAWKARYEIELIQKLPAFDQAWSWAVQSAWFDSFRQLVERYT